MLTSYKPLYLLCGVCFSLLLAYACHDLPDTNVEPGPDNGTDTVIVPPPPQNTDSIYYQGVDHTLQSPNAAYQIELDTPATLMLRFTIEGNFIRAQGQGAQILDNSTYGYADALTKCTEIGPQGHWSSGVVLLSSSNSVAAQFKGRSKVYLGFRFPATQGSYHYGWVQLACNSESSALTVSDFGYRSEPDSSILAGQKNLDVPCATDFGTAVPIQQLDSLTGNYHSEQSTFCNIYLQPSTDPNFDFTVQYFPFMWPYYQIPGKLENGKLKIPNFHFEGNIPSPGGQDRLYSGDISGTGELFEQNGIRTVVWLINYDKSGFLAESYHGEFVMIRCN